MGCDAAAIALGEIQTPLGDVSFSSFFFAKIPWHKIPPAASCVNLLTPCLGVNRAVFGAGCLDSVMETWGEQKISICLVVETMAISPKLAFHKKKLLENTGIFGIYFFG